MTKPSQAARNLVANLSPAAKRCLADMHWSSTYRGGAASCAAKVELHKAGLIASEYHISDPTQDGLYLTRRGKSQTIRAAVAEWKASLPPLSDFAATPEEIEAYREAVRAWANDPEADPLAMPENPDSNTARSARRDAALGITYRSNRPRSWNRRY